MAREVVVLSHELFDQITTKSSLLTDEMMKNCFQVFDQDRDNSLNLKEFHALTRALFCNQNGKPYPIEDERVEELFDIFDTNKDQKIDYNEFRICWNEWIKQILSPVSAFLVIDVQNDFISGSLSLKNCPAAHDGEEVVPVANYLLDSVAFDIVIYSLDWHPEDHVSFFENLHSRKLHDSTKVQSSEAKLFDTVVFEGPPVNEQILWPAHCIQGSWGSELHPDLKVVNGAVFIQKGINPDIDSYSAFWDNRKLSETKLLKELKERNVTDVYVCGLAYDVCVVDERLNLKSERQVVKDYGDPDTPGHTAFHALEHGFRTIVVDDACRGVSAEGIQNTKAKLTKHNGVIVDSEKVLPMVLGKDRNPILGYHAALQVAANQRR